MQNHTLVLGSAPMAGRGFFDRESSLAQISQIYDALDERPAEMHGPGTKQRLLARMRPEKIASTARATELSSRTLYRLPVGLVEGEKDQTTILQLNDYENADDFEIEETEAGPHVRVNRPILVPLGIPSNLKSLAICNSMFDVAACIELGAHAVGNHHDSFSINSLLMFVRWVPDSAQISFYLNFERGDDLASANNLCIGALAKVTDRSFQVVIPSNHQSLYEWYLRECVAYQGRPNKRAKKISRKIRQALPRCTVNATPPDSMTPITARDAIRTWSRQLELRLSVADAPLSAVDLAALADLELNRALEGLALSFRKGRINRRWGRLDDSHPPGWLYSLAAGPTSSARAPG